MWAPHATHVELVVADRKVEMELSGSGWFEAYDDEARTGDDYGFVLDGRGPFPDPRSPWQPEGIDGPSRIVDHSEYVWTDEAWTGRPLASGLVYEIHVGTFAPEGTLTAIATRLPYLKQLGINTIELMPIAQFTGTRGWGYDGVDLFAPHAPYGGPEGLKRLVDLCHSHGIGVILDVVYNHLGPAGNFIAEFGPYFTDRYATPWGPAVNLDGPDSDPVRDFFIDNALMWLEDYHLDGLRIDAIDAFVDTSALHFLEELSGRIRTLEARLGRTLWLIAESDLNDPRVVRGRDIGGYGLDAQWNDDFHHALHSVLTGEDKGYYADFGSVAQLGKSLRDAFVYDGRPSLYRSRRHGRPATGLSGHSFIGYLQNHDQVGNRPLGERIAELCGHDLLKVGAALVLTAPFIPMLFQGEEWGATSPFLYFTDHKDPGLGRAVTEGRRQEFADFGWSPHVIPDPQALDTFEWSILSWEEQEEQPHAELLEWYRTLIRLRRETPDLNDGRLDLVLTRYDEAKRWLVMERGLITVACNFSDERAKMPMPTGRMAHMLLTSKEPSHSGGSVTLPPQSVTIWSAQGSPSER